MTIYIATLLFFILFLLLNYAYEQKPNELFPVFYCMLSFQLAHGMSSNEHFYFADSSDMDRLLVAIIFCLCGQFNEMYLRYVKQVKNIAYSTEVCLKGFALGSVIIYVFSLMFFAEVDIFSLFMLAASGIAYILVIVVERGFRYFHTSPAVKR